MSNINIHGTNVQFVQSGTGIQDNRGQVAQGGLAARLDEILAEVATGRTADLALNARLAALEGELVAFGGSISDLQGMIEPLWTKYLTESNRSGFEVFVRGLPDKAAFFAMSQVMLRLITG